MTESAVKRIGQLVAVAREHDVRTGVLADCLSAHAERLHPLLALPSAHPRAALAGFVARYLDTLPELLAALEQELDLGSQAGALRPVLEVIEDYFLTAAPPTAEGQAALLGLLDRAYLGYRLLEEVNDQLRASAARPLFEWDMSFTNIVIHELLGETFANELDILVYFTVESLAAQGAFSENAPLVKHLNSATTPARQWPDLLEDFSIELALPRAQGSGAMH